MVGLFRMGLLSVLLLLFGCTAKGVDRPASVQVDGVVYCVAGRDLTEEVDESALLGELADYTDGMPSKDGEKNFAREDRNPYVAVPGGLAVRIDGTWLLFAPLGEP